MQLGNGPLRIHPALGFSGDDTFTYTLTDSRGETDEATVTVHVIGNVGPTAVDDVTNMTGGEPLFINVRANDYDDDGDFLTVDDEIVPSDDPEFPTATPEQPEPHDGTVTCFAEGCTYTPNSGFTGTDTFRYRVHDGHGAFGIARVSIGVNSPVVAVAIDSAPNPSTFGEEVDIAVSVYGARSG